MTGQLPVAYAAGSVERFTAKLNALAQSRNAGRSAKGAPVDQESGGAGRLRSRLAVFLRVRNTAAPAAASKPLIASQHVAGSGTGEPIATSTY